MHVPLTAPFCVALARPAASASFAITANTAFLTIFPGGTDVNTPAVFLKRCQLEGFWLELG
jgi:hypothetical protein